MLLLRLQKGGGVINFIMEEENLSFPDAVRFLARRANMPVPEEEHSDESRLRSRILSLNRDAARFYYDQLYSPKGVPVLEYMKTARSRGAMQRTSASAHRRTSGTAY